jgi:Zn-dependent protease
MLLQLGQLRDDPTSFFIFFVALAIALVVGITFHEMSHAIVADRLGDPGPRLMGRISLNPLHHLEATGTLMLVLVGFGWGKPVQVNPVRLRNGPELGMATVAAAGPISNFIQAAIFAIPLRFGLVDASLPVSFAGRYAFNEFSVSNYLAILFFYLVFINVILGVFNLIPLAPLDGSRVASALLPGEVGLFFRRIEPYGIGILFLLVMVGGLTRGAIDPINWVTSPLRTYILNLLL